MHSKRVTGAKMKLILKYFLVALLSLLSGIAFAYPLYYLGYVEPLNRVPEGPKPQLNLQVVYANFTMQNYDGNVSLPEWYDISRDGQPQILSFSIVVNATNYSDKPASIDFLSLCVGNSTARFNSIIQRSSLNGTVEGLWLDDEWINVTWVPQHGGIPAHWREGVDIERTFVNGTLVYVAMSINGTWTDVTNRVRLLEKDTIEPMSDSIVMTDLIARGEIRFFNPQNWQPDKEMPGYAVTNIDLSSGFNDKWEANQSRLLILKGTLPAPTKNSGSTAQDIMERLNSNLTLVRIQAIPSSWTAN